ncbi:hypothetical protein CSIM01_07060 [Colletotrichum simmondsii]|uniref:Uncharacterized protein n=1 Tax=Colletotrichum simmondsii TaxID=703756 RepID=A0A135RT75_9PEZI|nr:hypothetical protein CSIM01_07060 [Colletotrichum simmondsii]
MYPEYLLFSPRGQVHRTYLTAQYNCTLTCLPPFSLSYSLSNPNLRLSFILQQNAVGRVDGESSLDYAASQRVRRVIQRNHRHGLASLGVASCPPGGNPGTHSTAHVSTRPASATLALLFFFFVFFSQSFSTLTVDSSRGPPTNTSPRPFHSVWNIRLGPSATEAVRHPHMAPLQLWALALSSHRSSITG